VRQVLGDGQDALDASQDLTLDGYGFRWLRLASETG